MGKIGRVRIVFASSLVFLAACAGSPSADRDRYARSVRAGETFTLEQGGWASLDGTNFSLGFIAVREDSRCPREVACVWEGNARVAFTLREAVPGKKRGTLHEIVDSELDLNTSTRFERRYRFLNGFIELRGLDPSPPVSTPGSYVATMSFEGEQ